MLAQAGEPGRSACAECGGEVDGRINGPGWGLDLSREPIAILCAACTEKLEDNVAKVREHSNPYALTPEQNAVGYADVIDVLDGLETIEIMAGHNAIRTKRGTLVMPASIPSYAPHIGHDGKPMLTRPTYRSECECGCHEPGSSMMHFMPCCDPDPVEEPTT